MTYLRKTCFLKKAQNGDEDVGDSKECAKSRAFVLGACTADWKKGGWPMRPQWSSIHCLRADHADTEMVDIGYTH